jgi:hypothetical protein
VTGLLTENQWAGVSSLSALVGFPGIYLRRKLDELERRVPVRRLREPRSAPGCNARPIGIKATEA